LQMMSWFYFKYINKKISKDGEIKFIFFHI
jgi:hypothetical protein